MTRIEADTFSAAWAAAWNARDVERVVWDAAARELAIVYLSDIDGRARRVSENLTFAEDGLIKSAEVFHGVSER